MMYQFSDGERLKKKSVEYEAIELIMSRWCVGHRKQKQDFHMICVDVCVQGGVLFEPANRF